MRCLPHISVKRERGFSLLEVLVALSVLALCLGALLQVFASGLRATSLSGDYSRALMRAESLLAEVGSVRVLEIGHDSGRDDDGLRWQVEISEQSVSGEETGPQNRHALYAVRIEVRWEENRALHLETLRVGMRAR